MATADIDKVEAAVENVAEGRLDPPPRPKTGRSIKLDALRGVAILLVLGRHQRVDPSAAGAFAAPAALWQRFGWTGVDLFFVLSGFLVGGLLLKEILKFGNLHPTRFLVRRGLKIWPSYYLYLAWVAVWKLTHGGGVWHAVWPSVFNIQNYLWLVKPHLWSLGVEEHFYLVLPVLLLCFARTRALLAKPRVFVGIVAVLLICLCLRVITGDVADFQNRYYTHLRIDSLAFGFLLAYLFHVKPQLWKKLAGKRTLLFIVGLLAIAPAAILRYSSPWLGSFGLTSLYLGYGAILVACVSESAQPNWLDRILHGWFGRSLAFIGFSSYSIYLWHIDVGGEAAKAVKPFLFAQHAELHWLCVTAIFAVVSVAAGTLIGRAIEMPVLHLRDRLFPARAEITPSVAR